MAVTATLNVSGVAALRYILVDTTTFYFTNAVDGQKLVLTLQQDATGSRTVASGNCPGLQSPAATANTDTTQTLVYDAATNTWNQQPQSIQNGVVLNSYTTNTSIAWAKGVYAFTSSSTFTLTVTNPVAGPPGVGNDGEVMTFVNLSAKTNAVTMATGTTINASSTTATMAGAIGNMIALQAFGGKVYIVAASGVNSLT